MKKPSQKFNDGIVKIYTVDETCEPGETPVKSIILKATLRFKQRTVGYNRVYVESQGDIRVDNLIRCPLLKSIKALDIAVIGNEQYKIKRIQEIVEVMPKSMDLTLERLEGGLYDIE